MVVATSLDDMPASAVLVAVRLWVAALAVLDAHLALSRTMPPLYASGVRYGLSRDPEVSVLAPWPAVLARGWGACGDLVAWRLAELHLAGETTAAPSVEWVPGTQEIHVTLRRSNGALEDPSSEVGRLS